MFKIYHHTFNHVNMLLLMRSVLFQETVAADAAWQVLARQNARVPVVISDDRLSV